MNMRVFDTHAASVTPRQSRIDIVMNAGIKKCALAEFWHVNGMSAQPIKFDIYPVIPTVPPE